MADDGGIFVAEFYIATTHSLSWKLDADVTILAVYSNFGEGLAGDLSKAVILSFGAPTPVLDTFLVQLRKLNLYKSGIQVSLGWNAQEGETLVVTNSTTGSAIVYLAYQLNSIPRGIV